MFGLSLQGIAIDILSSIVASASDEIRELVVSFVEEQLKPAAQKTDNDWDDLLVNLFAEVLATDVDEAAQAVGEADTQKASTELREKASDVELEGQGPAQ